MQLNTVERARLTVDGVRRPITLDVAGRRQGKLVVAQALPFLRLGAAVTTDTGQRARIARVAIAMDGDTPKILLELMDAEDDADDRIERCGTPIGEPTVAPDSIPPEPPSMDATLADARDPSTHAPDTSDPDRDDTVQTFTPGVSTRPPRRDSTMPYEAAEAARYAMDRPSQEIVLVDAAPAPRIESSTLALPPRRGWLLELATRALLWLLRRGRPAAA
ncbi:MAG: hypothetical protein AB7S26_22900 [Sandaracinaceae bacterium]